MLSQLALRFSLFLGSCEVFTLVGSSLLRIPCGSVFDLRTAFVSECFIIVNFLVLGGYLLWALVFVVIRASRPLSVDVLVSARVLSSALLISNWLVTH